jgi:hypothetical protein
MNTSERNKLDNIHFKLSIIEVMTYAIVAIPSLVTLGFDKTLGPLKSSEYVLLLLRNIGMICWYTCIALGARRVQLQAGRILNSLSINSGDSGEGSQKTSPRQVAAVAVVEFLKQNDKELAIRAAFSVIVWSIASIPQLWPFHGYFMAILASIAAFKGNSSQVLIRSRYKMYSSQNRTQTTPPTLIPSLSKNEAENNLQHNENSHQVQPFRGSMSDKS